MANTSRHNNSSANIERKKLKEHFKQRAENPPNEALPWSSAWEDYEEEMHEIERQLTEMGVIL